MTSKICEEDIEQIFSSLNEFKSIVLKSKRLPLSEFPGQLPYIRSLILNSTNLSSDKKRKAINHVNIFVAEFNKLKFD